MTKVGFFGKWQEFRAIGKTQRTDFNLVVLFIKISSTLIAFCERHAAYFDEQNNFIFGLLSRLTI